jgi:YidC/Oxa1 family membrane protein insertase
MSSDGWSSIKHVFTNMDSVFDATQKSMSHVNNFLGLNIGDTPWHILISNFKAGVYLMVIGALIIPIASYLSQVLNIKLMPTAASAGNDQMAQQMKMMNTMMPLFSFFMCFTVPVGLGIYWIAGAVVRSVQQYFLNKHMEKIDLDDIIKKNQEKAKKKREKKGIAENQITNAARMSTKANTNLSNAVTFADKERMLEEAKAKRENAKAGSMASKANMVKEFNEKNNK